MAGTSSLFYLALAIGAVISLTLVACKPEHNFGEWQKDGGKETLCDSSRFSRTCADCGEVEWRDGTFSDHKIIYHSDSVSHWSKCENCEYTTEATNHTINDSGLCTGCDQLFTYTVGLVFELSESGDYYRVVSYEGTQQDVVIPSLYDGKPVTSIGDLAFRGCSSLTSVIIPDSVTSIGELAFRGCSSLTSVTIPDSVTTIERDAFTDCDNLQFNEYGNLKFLGNIDNPYLALIAVSDGTLSNYEIHSECKNIAEAAFSDCIGLTSITIPDSVTSMGNAVFNACINLESITIGGSVTSIGVSAFNYCSSLESITIPDSVTSIGNFAFCDCSSLESVMIGNGVTSIGEYVFSECRILESITVSENNVAYKSIAGNLYTKDEKTLIQYAVGKTENEFAIPNSVTSIGEEAFYGCYNLESVTIGGSVESIGNRAFAGCINLEGITIGNSVTRIGDSAFSSCSSLESITIPDSVTRIGDSAFAGCRSLVTIYYNGTASEWNDIEIEEYNDSLTSVTIYYYSENEPQEQGNYWHYDDNGEVVIW